MNNFGVTGTGFNDGMNPYQQNMLNTQIHQTQFGQNINTQIPQNLQENQFNNFNQSNINQQDIKQNIGIGGSNINYYQGSNLDGQQQFQSNNYFNQSDNYSKNFNNFSNQFQSIQNPNLNQFGNMPNPENYSQNFNKNDYQQEQVQNNLMQNQSQINNNFNNQFQSQIHTNNNNLQNPQISQSVNYNNFPNTGYNMKENKSEFMMNQIPSSSIMVNNQFSNDNNKNHFNNQSVNINQLNNDINKNQIYNQSVNINGFNNQSKFNLDNIQVIPPNNESIKQEMLKNSNMLDSMELSKSVIIKDNNFNLIEQSQQFNNNQFSQTQQIGSNQVKPNNLPQGNFGIGGGIGMNFHHSSSNLDPNNPYNQLGSMNFFKNPQDVENNKNNQGTSNDKDEDDLGFPNTK
jgi:hypothetical protein